MEVQRKTPPVDRSLRLNVLCARHGEAWRLYVWPGPRPPVLDKLLDRYGEAYPVQFDFEDLDRYLASQQAEVEKRWSRTGEVELTAYGPSAYVLAAWLATAVSSGVRS